MDSNKLKFRNNQAFLLLKNKEQENFQMPKILTNYDTKFFPSKILLLFIFN